MKELAEHQDEAVGGKNGGKESDNDNPEGKGKNVTGTEACDSAEDRCQAQQEQAEPQED
ncbi:hypothetical protein JCM15764A_16040 [Geotalea toluenoxydans]